MVMNIDYLRQAPNSNNFINADSGIAITRRPSLVNKSSVIKNLKKDVFQKDIKTFLPKDFEEGRVTVKEAKEYLKEAVEKKDYNKIFRTLGIDVKDTKRGHKIISEYRQPSKDVMFYNLGISEDDLLKQVYKIERNADFSHSAAKGTGGVKIIGGDFIPKKYGFKDVNVKVIRGKALLNGWLSNNGFNSLKAVGNDVVLGSGNVNGLNGLKVIRGDFKGGSFVNDLPAIKNIAGKIIHNNSDAIQTILKRLSKAI